MSDNERVDAVARAMAEANGVLWNSLTEKIGTCDYYRRLAAAAIAADPSPAEEAVKRVEALADTWEARARAYAAAGDRDKATDLRQRSAALRAALASPAPAPQEDTNGCPDQPHHGVDCPGDACRYATAPAPKGGGIAHWCAHGIHATCGVPDCACSCHAPHGEDWENREPEGRFPR
jgi:hypothetical protein